MLSCCSCVQLFVTLWTVVCQAPLSLEFSLQEYWTGLPFPSLEDLSDPGIKLSDGFFTSESSGRPTLPASNLYFKSTQKNSGSSRFPASDLPCSPNVSLVGGERHFLCDIDNVLLYLSVSCLFQVSSALMTEGRKKTNTISFL